MYFLLTLTTQFGLKIGNRYFLLFSLIEVSNKSKKLNNNNKLIKKSEIYELNYNYLIRIYYLNGFHIKS